jgi:chloride channel protein, CIC family
VQEIMFAREVFALPVLDDDGDLTGIVSMSDITKIERSERGNVDVSAVYSREVKVAFPDQTMHEVVERMREFHLANFPVVSRKNEKQLLGMISKSDIMLAYRKMALELSF